jgi:thioredoxin reductase
MSTVDSLPVAVIGAGPVGLAAAAHLVRAGQPFVVIEAAEHAGGNVRSWGHVRTFSDWAFNIDEAARDLLTEAGWNAPDPREHPTGDEIADRYLDPLAELPQVAPHLLLGTRVQGISREGVDRMKSVGRDSAPFVLDVVGPEGSATIRARAVIDASGTFATPNPLGANGLEAPGEAEAWESIFYGIPDVTGAHRERYAGRRVLVAGSGHSAFNALLDLARLQVEVPSTTIAWAVRRDDASTLFARKAADQLPERGALGTSMQHLLDSGAIRLVSGFRITAVQPGADGLKVVSGDRAIGPFDEIIAATGFRPDVSVTRELRVDLDPIMEAPPALAPLIDPNLHSCGTVPPHGEAALRHPEPNFYIVGMKSYGRAPTFLMLTGYEQVRSVVAALAGDMEAAREVHLVLPESGACSSSGPDEAVAVSAGAGCGAGGSGCGG